MGVWPILHLRSFEAVTGAKVVSVGKGRIAKVYLLDALVQLATAGAWRVAARGANPSRHSGQRRAERSVVMPRPLSS